MEKRVFIMTFAEDSKAYQAFSNLKRKHTDKEVVLEHLAVVKNDAETEKLDIKDFIDLTGADKTARGSFIGLFVGILGGPLGMLLGWMSGTFIGARKDAREIEDAVSVFEETLSMITPGKTGLIVIGEAESRDSIRTYVEDELEGRMLQLDLELVMEQVERARETEQELKKEARRKMFRK